MAFCNEKCVNLKFAYSAIPLFLIPRFTNSLILHVLGKLICKWLSISKENYVSMASKNNVAAESSHTCATKNFDIS